MDDCKYLRVNDSLDSATISKHQPPNKHGALRQAFTYRPLERPESIRVLLLHPSSDDSSPLICELVHDDRLAIQRDASENRQFDAVSYAWGSEESSQELLCESEKSTLRITDAVDRLLRSLRDKSRIRRLWVDGVCFNQKDEDEKKVQVPLMEHIYRLARCVLVFLGETDENLSKAFASLSSLGAVSGQAERKASNKTKMNTQIISMDLITQFLKLRWFERRWILQEVALAREVIVYLGREKMAWDCFAAGLVAVQSRLSNRNDVEEKTLYALRAISKLRKLNGNILDLLWDYHGAECSHPKDKLYSLLAMAKDVRGDLSGSGAPRDIPFQPKNDEEWVDLFAHFTQLCITAGQSKAIEKHKSAFGTLYQTDCTLPSWVPDWRQTRKEDLDPPARSRRRTKKIAGSSQLFKPSPGSLQAILNPEGNRSNVYLCLAAVMPGNGSRRQTKTEQILLDWNSHNIVSPKAVDRLDWRDLCEPCDQSNGITDENKSPKGAKQVLTITLHPIITRPEGESHCLTKTVHQRFYVMDTPPGKPEIILGSTCIGSAFLNAMVDQSLTIAHDSLINKSQHFANPKVTSDGRRMREYNEGAFAANTRKSWFRRRLSRAANTAAKPQKISENQVANDTSKSKCSGDTVTQASQGESSTASQHAERVCAAREQSPLLKRPGKPSSTSTIQGKVP